MALIIVVVVTFARFLVKKRDKSSSYHVLRQWRWRLAEFPCWEEKKRENRFVIVDWNAFWLDSSRGCTLENEVTFISFFISSLSLLLVMPPHSILSLIPEAALPFIKVNNNDNNRKKKGKRYAMLLYAFFLYSHSCVFFMQKFFDFPSLSLCLSLVHFHFPFSHHLAMPCFQLIIITRQPPLTLLLVFSFLFLWTHPQTIINSFMKKKRRKFTDKIKAKKKIENWEEDF